MTWGLQAQRCMKLAEMRDAGFDKIRLVQRQRAGRQQRQLRKVDRPRRSRQSRHARSLPCRSRRRSGIVASEMKPCRDRGQDFAFRAASRDAVGLTPAARRCTDLGAAHRVGAFLDSAALPKAATDGRLIASRRSCDNGAPDRSQCSWTQVTTVPSADAHKTVAEPQAVSERQHRALDMKAAASA